MATRLDWCGSLTTGLLCVLSLVRLVTPQTCVTVTEEYITCAQGASPITVSLACPEKYIIKLMSSEYYVSDLPVACPPPGPPPPSHCLAGPDPGGVVSQCDKKTSCSVTVARTRSCGGNGVHYVRMVYICEPLQYINTDKASVTFMDSSQSLSGVQLVYISSSTKVLTENDVTFGDTSLGCIISVPENVEIFFQMLYILKSPPQSGCNQKIQFWDGVRYVKTLCAANNQGLTLAGCDVSERTLYLSYVNDDPSVKVGFVLAAGVSHQVRGLDMRCALETEFLPPVVVAPPAATTPAPNPGPNPTPNPTDIEGRGITEAQEEEDGKSLMLIIILVSVTIFLVIVVIIIGVVIKKLSRKPTILEESEPEDLSQAKPTNVYVRDVYLDGMTSSRLVMDKRRASGPYDGSTSRI